MGAGRLQLTVAFLTLRSFLWPVNIEFVLLEFVLLAAAED